MGTDSSAVNGASCESAWGQPRMALEPEALDSGRDDRRPKEGQMSAAIVARAGHTQHRERSGLLGRATRRASLRSPCLSRRPSPRERALARTLDGRRAAVSGAERFGPGSDISTILICYDGTPGARQAVEHAGRLLPGSRAVVLNVWSSPAGLAACGLAGTAPHDFEDWNRAASDVAAEGVQLCEGGGAGCSCTHDQRHGRGDLEIDPCFGRRVRRGPHRRRLSRSDGSASHHCRLRFEEPRRACSTARARRAGRTCRGRSA